MISQKTKTRLRRIGLTLAALALVALAALTVLRYLGSRELERAAARFEATVGPLDFAAYRPDPVPDADNAALPVLEAAERAEGLIDEDCRIGALARPNRRAAADWSDEDWRQARRVVDCGREVAEILDRAVGRSGSSFGLDYSAGPEMEIPNLLHVNQTGHLLFTRARLAWREGRTDEAVRAVETLAAVSRALQGEPPLIFQLVGLRVERLQHRAIQEGLAGGDANGLDVETLRRLRAAAAERPRTELFRRSLGTEGAMVYHLRPGSPAAEALVSDRSWLDRVEHRWLGDGAVAGDLEYCARVARAAPTLTHAETLDRPELLSPPESGTPLAVNFGHSVATLKATEALARLARLALDLAMESAQGGAFPTELPSTPEAGADPFAGNPPLYERSADGTATLSIPGAEELWRQMRPPALEGGREEAELFTWHLRR